MVSVLPPKLLKRYKRYIGEYIIEAIKKYNKIWYNNFDWSETMGKLSNMMYMIDLLNTGNIYTLKELSEKIGVTERMIRYYKNEICANGIAIESFKGPNGGYFMIVVLTSMIFNC